MDFFREGSKKEILDEIVKPGRKKDSWPNLLSYDKNKKNLPLKLERSIGEKKTEEEISQYCQDFSGGGGKGRLK